MISTQEPLKVWLHLRNIAHLYAGLHFIAYLREQLMDVQLLLTIEDGVIPLDVVKNIQESVLLPCDKYVNINSGDFNPISEFRPKLLLLVEKPLALKMVQFGKKHTISVMLISGLMTDLECENWSSEGKMHGLIGNIDRICALEERDAKNFRYLGFDPSIIKITGSLKHESAKPFPFQQKLGERLLKQTGFDQNQPVLMGASLTEKEALMMLDVFTSLKRQIPRLVLFLSTRSLDDLLVPIKKIQSLDFNHVLRSQIGKSKAGQMTQTDIFVIDTIGEQRFWYSYASVIVLGRSFDKFTGSNFEEPFYFGKPVIVGPGMTAFETECASAVRANALIQLAHSDELTSEIFRLLNSKSELKKIEANTKNWLNQNTGAMQRTLEILQELSSENSQLTKT